MKEAPRGFDLALIYRLAPGFLAGVGAGVFGLGEGFLLLMAAALLGGLSAARLHPERFGPWLLFLLLSAVVTMAGLARARLGAPPPRPAGLKQFLGQKISARARVLDFAHPSVGGVRVTVELTEIAIDGKEPNAKAEKATRTGPPVRAVLYVAGEKNAWIYSPGAGLRVWGRLDVPRGNENPGIHSYREYLERRGIYAQLYVLSPRAARVEKWPSGWRVELVKKGGAFSRWVAGASVQGAALVPALSVGDRSGIGEELTEALRASGTSHILAISGLHVGIAGAFFFFLVRWLLLRWAWLARRLPARKAAALMALFGIALYALVSGASDATQRAATLLGIAALALLLERRVRTPRSLLVVAALLLALDPGALTSISFELSFAAAGAIVLAFQGAAPWFDRLRPERGEVHSWRGRLTRPILRSLLAIALSSLAANLATWPLVAFYFNRFSFNGLAANLFVLPLVEFVLLPASLLTLGVWPLSAAWARPLLSLAGLAGRAVEAVAGFFAHGLPFEVTLGTPRAVEIFLYLASLLILLLAWVWKDRRLFRAGAALGIVYVLCLVLLGGAGAPEDLQAEVLEVGRRRVTLVQWPGGERALVDVSRSSSPFAYAERVVVPVLATRGATRVDLLVFAGEGEAAERALSHYKEALAFGDLWRLSPRAPAVPKRWPPGAGPPLAELLPKGRRRISGEGQVPWGEGSLLERGWVLALYARKGRYVIDGAGGYWPTAWAESWREGPLVFETSTSLLRRPATKWLLSRVSPRLVILPEGAPRFASVPEQVPLLSGGWGRVQFRGEKIEVERDQFTRPTM